MLLSNLSQSTIAHATAQNFDEQLKILTRFVCGCGEMWWYLWLIWEVSVDEQHTGGDEHRKVGN